jgi:hypothetical protein
MNDHPSIDDAARLAEHEVLAEREYHLESPDGPRKILVQVGFPKRCADNGRYECVAVLLAGEISFRRPMNGVDAVEALQLALKILSVELSFIAEQLEGRLSWAEGTRHETGFDS